jgi:hypothetical protein
VKHEHSTIKTLSAESGGAQSKGGERAELVEHLLLRKAYKAKLERCEELSKGVLYMQQFMLVMAVKQRANQMSKQQTDQGAVDEMQLKLDKVCSSLGSCKEFCSGLLEELRGALGSTLVLEEASTGGAAVEPFSDGADDTATGLLLHEEESLLLSLLQQLEQQPAQQSQVQTILGVRSLMVELRVIESSVDFNAAMHNAEKAMSGDYSATNFSYGSTFFHTFKRVLYEIEVGAKAFSGPSTSSPVDANDAGGGRRPLIDHIQHLLKVTPILPTSHQPAGISIQDGNSRQVVVLGSSLGWLCFYSLALFGGVDVVGYEILPPLSTIAR